MRYDPISSSLVIAFVSGVIYRYKEVPEEKYEAMKASRSKGWYHNKYIKPNYDFEKLN